MMLPTIVSLAVNLLEDVLRRSRRNAELILLVATFTLLFELTFPQHALAAQSVEVPISQSVSAASRASGQLPLSADRQYQVTRSVRVSITAYSSTREETDADPFTTASGQKVHDGIVAMNGVPFGTKVRIPEHFGNKVFVVADRMHPRYGTRYLDIWMASKAQAKQWGVKRTTVDFIE